MKTGTIERADMSDVLRAVVERRGYPVMDMAEIDAATASEPLSMIFLAGDYWRLAESDDVAAVLPELERALEGHARIIVAKRVDERALQRRYHFRAYPALIFMQNGQYLGAIEGIRDWSNYLVEIPEILGREPAAPPPFELPSGCNGATQGAAK